jgi:hypothetical protein
MLKPHEQTHKYNRSGIYQTKCLDCPLKYMGKSGRELNIRYIKDIHAIRSNNIYRISKNNLHKNDIYTDIQNPIFESFAPDISIHNPHPVTTQD